MRTPSIALLAALVAIGGVAGYRVAPRIRGQVSEPAARAEASMSPRRELVLIYIGASTCGPSNDPRLPAWISEAADTLRLRAGRVDASAVTVGIAREMDIAAGTSHLARTFEFDEISVGQRERNHLSQKYISREFPGIAATPQVLVLLREYDELPFGGIDAGSVREALLLRRVGLQEVESWVRLGTPIPSRVASPQSTADSTLPF